MSELNIAQIIDEVIISVWENEIQNDYKKLWLLKEDSLKNALYFHLRTNLEKVFNEHDIRIFTEFTDCEFKHSGYRPDMVIARINPDADVAYWGDAVTECIAVIELKYKTGFAANEEIYADYNKLEHYIDTLGVNSKLYMATIWECEDDDSAWLQDAEWAAGKVVELNASYKRDSDYEPQFYVVKH